jgi:hypothetical protein
MQQLKRSPCETLTGSEAETASAARDLAFDAIMERCELAGSYARSASEAAWRGDQITIGVHLRQLPLCVIAGILAFKLLDGEVRP